VEHVMPEYGVGQLFGPTYMGKSFVGLDLALRLANHEETEWFGHAINRHGPVVYVLMEGSWDFPARIDAWTAVHPGTSDDQLFTIHEEPLSLRDTRSMALLSDSISASGVEPVMVVIDTQSLATPGTDENSNTEMNQVFANVKHFAKGLNCFVLLVHHTGHDQSRSRGASAQRAALDLEIQVADGRLVVTKVKGYKESRPYDFALRPSGNSAYVDTSLWPTLMDRAQRVDQRDAQVKDKILDAVRARPGMNDGDLFKAVGGGAMHYNAARDALVTTGVIVDDSGGGRGRTRSWRLVRGDAS